MSSASMTGFTPLHDWPHRLERIVITKDSIRVDGLEYLHEWLSWPKYGLRKPGEGCGLLPPEMQVGLQRMVTVLRLAELQRNADVQSREEGMREEARKIDREELMAGLKAAGERIQELELELVAAKTSS